MPDKTPPNPPNNNKAQTQGHLSFKRSAEAVGRSVRLKLEQGKDLRRSLQWREKRRSHVSLYERRLSQHDDPHRA